MGEVAREHLAHLVRRAVDYLNVTKPRHWPIAVASRTGDLVAWAGTGAATGVRECDMTDSVGPQTWYWQLPDKDSAPNFGFTGYTEPIRPLFDMIEATYEAGQKDNAKRVDSLLDNLVD